MLQAVDTVIAGILHDVIDDTGESLLNIRESFGNDVAQMVAGVSRLSYINQVLKMSHLRTCLLLCIGISMSVPPFLLSLSLHLSVCLFS